MAVKMLQLDVATHTIGKCEIRTIGSVRILANRAVFAQCQEFKWIITENDMSH